jgi:hypothetical protein
MQAVTGAEEPAFYAVSRRNAALSRRTTERLAAPAMTPSRASCQGARDGLDGEAEMVGNVRALHRQIEAVVARHALGDVEQEGRDLL